MCGYAQAPARQVGVRWLPTDALKLRAKAARDKPASWARSSSVQARSGASWMRARARAVCAERTPENQSFAVGEAASAQSRMKYTNKDDSRLRTTI
jgi:hypothetical protein